MTADLTSVLLYISHVKAKHELINSSYMYNLISVHWNTKPRCCSITDVRWKLPQPREKNLNWTCRLSDSRRTVYLINITECTVCGSHSQMWRGTPNVQPWQCCMLCLCNCWSEAMWTQPLTLSIFKWLVLKKALRPHGDSDLPCSLLMSGSSWGHACIYSQQTPAIPWPFTPLTLTMSTGPHTCIKTTSHDGQSHIKVILFTFVLKSQFTISLREPSCSLWTLQ